jgi:hypothetical protein
MAQSSLPDRNPFGSAASYYGSGGAEESSLDWIAASHVSAELDPLNPRPAREIWRLAGTMDAYRVIPGGSKFFATVDFRALDVHLLQQSGGESVQRAVYHAQCSAVREPGITAFNFKCASAAAAAHGVNLAGRYY